MIAGLEIEVRVGSAISLLLSLLAGVTLAAVPASGPPTRDAIWTLVESDE